jgi:cyclophilin family peptidyl-prolyl cis-trans isomerase
MKFWSAVLAILIACLSSAHAGVLARFQMSPKLGGTIDVELYDLDKPVTVSNFVAYVRSGQWHDSVLHRWSLDFFLQGGYFKKPHDPTLMSPQIGSQPQAVTTFPPIPFERNVGRLFKNEYGTIAMGHDATNVNTATAGWYFNLKDNPTLDTEDGGYTVFGRVIRGTNILNKFTRAALDPHLYYVTFTEVPTWSEDEGNTLSLLHMDITVLTVEISLLRGRTLGIAWNSVEGLPNIVEHAGRIPTIWQPLQTVTGTGGRMSVIADPAGTEVQHYRVRIDYGQ